MVETEAERIADHRRIALRKAIDDTDEIGHIVRMSWYAFMHEVGIEDARAVVAAATGVRRWLVRALSDIPEVDVRGVATTLEGAVRAAADADAEVVVLGALPDTTPADACRAVCAAVPGARVLVVSGDDAPEAVAAAFAAGALGFLRYEGLDDKAFERAVLSVAADLKVEPAYDHPA